MANLAYGSSGSEVKKMQEALVAAGYDVGSSGADGVFGANTQTAVRKYQQDHGLAVDGIAGSNTLGSLYSSNTAATTDQTPVVTAPTTPTFTYDDFSYDPFTPSDIVNQANALIQQQQANKPGSYTPVWQDEADAYLNQYQNRGPFSYDFNSDALYNQYKDNYIQQGQMAMMDTMGQAAALTGGYGNSYAQTVGQQAYNQYLGQLNNVLPELYQMAHDRYNQEGQELLAMYDLYMDKENQEYGKWRDSVDIWNQDMDRLTDNYNTLYNREYNQYADDKGIAHGDYLIGREEAWDEYLSNKDKEQTAAELMASAGNYDRLQALYGLTDAEVSAIQTANAPVSTGSSSGSKTGKKYKDISVGTDAYNRMTSDIASADSLEKLNSICNEYIGLDYNPSQVYALISSKRSELENEEEGSAIDTNIPDYSPEVPWWEKYGGIDLSQPIDYNDLLNLDWRK